jgi:hypothetical protein
VSIAYVDSSWLVAIAFDEPGARRRARRMAEFRQLASSALLEAEVKAALAREGVGDAPRLFAEISWILPDRPLSVEITRVLAVGRLRGADLWHVACALYLAPDPTGVAFLSLDGPQREIAATMGFAP